MKKIEGVQWKNVSIKLLNNILQFSDTIIKCTDEIFQLSYKNLPVYGLFNPFPPILL